MTHNLFSMEKNIPEASQAHGPLISPEKPSLSSPAVGLESAFISHRVCKAYKMAATACLLTQSVGSLLRLLKGILPQHLGKPQHPSERE